MDIERDRYKDLHKKYDFFQTVAYDMDLTESEIQLEKWSNYGAFGIANVSFSVRQDNKNKVAYYSQQIDKINQILNNRKSLLDYKIGLIDGEIVNLRNPILIHIPASFRKRNQHLRILTRKKKMLSKKNNSPEPFINFACGK